MQLFYKNYISTSTLTPLNTPAFQDVESLKIPHLSRTFTQDNSGADPYIKIDLGEAKLIRSVIVDIGSLTSSSTVLLEWSDDDFATVEDSEEMIYAETCFYYKNPTGITYRYFRITMTDTADEITIGYISIGDYITLPGVDPAATIKYATSSTRQLSISMQTYGDEGLNYMATTFRFPVIPEQTMTLYGEDLATRKDIIEMYREVQNINPIWLFIWEEILDKFPPVFCVIDQTSIDFQTSINPGLYSTNISFLEVK